jgi:predicted PurR-regulated permease PerM
VAARIPPRTPSGTREGLIRAGTAAWALVGIIILVIFGVWLLYQVRAIFPPLVLALALIFLLNPVVSWLERRGLKRIIATIVLYLVFFTVVGVVVGAITPVLRGQFEDLGDRVPEIQEKFESFAERVGGSFGLSRVELRTTLEDTLDRLREQFFTGVGQITQFAGSAFHLVLIFVLAPFLALYLLIDLPRLQNSFVNHLPPQYRDEWLLLLDRCGQAVGGFFRGQLVVAAIVGVLSALLLFLVGIPFWLPIGLLVGFFNLIPLIGPFIGGLIAVIIGAVDGGISKALYAGIAMIAVQQVDNHFISPNVMGRTLRIHPVTIILALLAGGTIAGLWGMLLAVPATAVGKIVVMHYYMTAVLGKPPEEAFPEIVEVRRRVRRAVRKAQESGKPAPAGMAADAAAEPPAPSGAPSGSTPASPVPEPTPQPSSPSTPASGPSTGSRGRSAGTGVKGPQDQPGG